MSECVCRKIITDLLTKEQKAAKINWCKKALNCSISVVTYGSFGYKPVNKRHSCVWVFQYKEKPTKIIHSQSVSKMMVAAFVSKTIPVVTVSLQDRRTITVDWYTTIFLTKVSLEL